MSGSFGPSPLSPGQFNGLQNQSGWVQGTQGIGGLANIIAGGPRVAAEGKALGAQTAFEQSKTAAAGTLASDSAEFKTIMSDPANLTNPATIQRASALMAAHPEIAQYGAQSMATIFAASHAAGGPVSQGTSDALSAGVGVQAYGNTPTGQAADLTNRTGIAQIGANAGVTEAGIGAGASEYGADQGLAGTKAGIAGANFRQANDPVRVIYQGKVTQVPGYFAEQNHLPLAEASVDSAQAHLLQGATAPGAPIPAVPANPYAQGGDTTDTNLSTVLGPVPGMTVPGSVGSLGGAMPRGASALFGTTPPGGDTSAAVTAAATPPGASPPAQTEADGPPKPGTIGAPPPDTNAEGVNAPSAPSPLGQQIAQQTVAHMTGQPQAKALTPDDAQAMTAAITQRLQKQYPSGPGGPTDNGGYQPSQPLMNAIRLRAGEYYASGPSGVKANIDAAITKAIQDVTGVDGSNVSKENHTGRFWTTGPSSLNITDPNKMAPDPFAKQGAAPSISSTIAGPAPAPAPQTPSAPPATPQAPVGQQAGQGGVQDISGPNIAQAYAALPVGAHYIVGGVQKIKTANGQ